VIESIVERPPEPQVASQRSRNANVLDKRPGVAPIAKANRGVVRASATSDHESHNVDADNEHDLQHRKTKLQFPIDSDEEKGGDNHQNSENRDEGAVGQVAFALGVKYVCGTHDEGIQ
jgi:hypothetical protein